MDTVSSGADPPRGRSVAISDLLAGWSLVGVGAILVVGSLVGGVRYGTEFGTTYVLFPLVASGTVVAAGFRLRRGDLTVDDVALIAAWVAATVVVFGVVVLSAAFVMTDDPIPIAALVATFMVPIGAVAGGIAGHHDVRRRQQHRVTRRTEQALETATDGIAILDADGEYVAVNRAHAAVYGYDEPDSMIGETWHVCYDGDETARFEQHVMPALEETGEWRGEATGLRADGTTFPQELTLTRMDDGGLVCVVRDVSDRRDRGRRLREQTRQLRTIVENVPIVLFAFEEDGEITLSEGRSLRALGLEPGEAVGESVFGLYGDVPAVVDTCERALEGETVHDTADLGDAVFEMWMSPVVDDDGEVEQVIGTAMDVTEQHDRKRQLSALHEASRQLTYATTREEVARTTVEIAEEVLDKPVSTLWRYDPDGDRLVPAAMTDSSREFLGVEDVDELQAVTAGGLGMEVFLDGELRAIEDYQTVENAAFDVPFGTVYLVPLGEHGLLEVGQREVEPITDAGRRHAGILGLNSRAAFDRAEHEELLRERTEQLEVRTSQMEFINGILRHDVFNGMTVIRARGRGLEEELDGRYHEDAETIVASCDDIIDFVQRVQTVLGALSGDQEVTLEVVDAVELLEAELDRVRRTYPEATLESSLPEAAPVRADVLLGDVLGNVVRNAVEHNDPAGLTVRVDADVGDETTTFRIADDGAGIPPERHESVFRRGESRDASTGSGFGLFFVDAMVEAYGGDVRIEDNDPGAAFVITLPTGSPEPVEGSIWGTS